MTEESQPQESKLAVCAGCGWLAQCTNHDDEWLCAVCVEKDNETAAWDEMLIEDAEEGGFI
jgi:hypothetical protein